MNSEEMASKLLAGVPSVFWHNIPESHLLVARELPGVQGAEELEGCFLARADFDAGVGRCGSPSQLVGLQSDLLRSRRCH